MHPTATWRSGEPGRRNEFACWLIYWNPSSASAIEAPREEYPASILTRVASLASGAVSRGVNSPTYRPLVLPPRLMRRLRRLTTAASPLLHRLSGAQPV